MKIKLLIVALVIASFALGIFVGHRVADAELAALAELIQSNSEIRAAAEVIRSVQILETLQSGRFDALEAAENVRLDFALSNLIWLREQNPGNPLFGAPQAAVCRAQIYRSKHPRPAQADAAFEKRNKRIDEFLASPK